MISKIQALGKEISLTTEVENAIILERAKLLSILRDYNPEIASELEFAEFSIRIESNMAVIYRDSAVLG